MSYRAAYDHSETIAAIASLAGASHIDDRPAPANPVHVLQIHGTNDGTIAYNGGDIAGNASIPAPMKPSRSGPNITVVRLRPMSASCAIS